MSRTETQVANRMAELATRCYRDLLAVGVSPHAGLGETLALLAPGASDRELTVMTRALLEVHAAELAEHKREKP